MSALTYPSPLQGYHDLPPLPEALKREAKGSMSHVNPQIGIMSDAYDRFVDPIENSNGGGFDVHVYFFQNNPTQMRYAEELHERIRRELPELRIYTIARPPEGPHPIGMFEVNLLTPREFGAFVPWLVVLRGPLSVLVHPNTEVEGDEDGDVKDHTLRAMWMGKRIPLDLEFFRRMKVMQREGRDRKALEGLERKG
ncbi:hypothetical protein MMC25_005780 [Agyrium rufum]|nr:hypothetical protein [Agyrium rufum]